MNAAIYARVSTEDQDAGNQVLELQAFAQRRGWTVRHVYTAEASAWTGAQLRQLTEIRAAARRGEFDVLLIWSLDRLSRQGPLATLEAVHQLAGAGAQVVSLQEPWTEVGGELLDLLLAIAGWVARMESQRRSERTRAGLDRARAAGVQLGRPRGSKDKTSRRRTGYLLRYADRGASNKRDRGDPTRFASQRSSPAPAANKGSIVGPPGEPA